MDLHSYILFGYMVIWSSGYMTKYNIIGRHNLSKLFPVPVPCQQMVFETMRAKSVMKAVLRQGKQRYLQGKATALNPITLAFVGFSRNPYLFSILYLKQKNLN